VTHSTWILWPKARRLETDRRMKPLHARSHRAARVQRDRMRAQRVESMQTRHLRSIAREGDDGNRCWDCKHIPLHPWEHAEFGVL